MSWRFCFVIKKEAEKIMHLCCRIEGRKNHGVSVLSSKKRKKKSRVSLAGLNEENFDNNNKARIVAKSLGHGFFISQ